MAFNPLNPTGGSSGLQATESTHTLQPALAAGSSCAQSLTSVEHANSRFGLPITIGLLKITTNDLRPQIIYLDIAEKALRQESTR